MNIENASTENKSDLNENSTNKLYKSQWKRKKY